MNKNLKPVIAVAGVSLAVSLAFTGLVGCNNTPAEGDETTTLPSIYDTTTDPAGSGTVPGPDATTDEITTKAPETAPTYTEVNETVYVIVASVNLREGPGTGYASHGIASEGQSFTRIKYSESWSVVKDSEGNEYYISSDCLSTKSPSSTDVTFEAIDTTVYVTVEKANVRTKPDLENSEVKYVAVKDQAITAIGISTDGKWYKVNYLDTEKNEEHVLYISASVVTAKKAGSDFTKTEKQIKVIVEKVSIRTYPSTKEEESTIIAVAVKDQVLNVIGVSPDGNWYMIKYELADGSTMDYFVTAGSTYVADVAGSAVTTEAATTEAATDPAGTTA